MFGKPSTSPEGETKMTTRSIFVTALSVLAVSPAFALGLTTTDPGTHVPGTYNSFAAARGVNQTANWKSTLVLSGENPGQTANTSPSNYYDDTRHWEVKYTVADGNFNFSLYDTADNSGSVLMNIDRVMLPTLDFVGLRIDGRANTVNQQDSGLTVDDVKFNGVDVDAMEFSMTTSNPARFREGTFHWFDGPVDDFVLSGTVNMDWNMTNHITSDRMSFDVRMIEAEPVPEPATMIALGTGALALIARRRRKA
jgi:hypothetical protein